MIMKMNLSEPLLSYLLLDYLLKLIRLELWYIITPLFVWICLKFIHQFYEIVSAFQPSSPDSSLVGRGVIAAQIWGGSAVAVKWYCNVHHDLNHGLIWFIEMENYLESSVLEQATHGEFYGLIQLLKVFGLPGCGNIWPEDVVHSVMSPHLLCYVLKGF